MPPAGNGNSHCRENPDGQRASRVHAIVGGTGPGRTAVESRKKTRATAVAMAVTLGAIYGFGSSPAAELDDQVMIANQLAERWVDAYNRKDAAALGELYSNEAMLLPMGYPRPV